MILCNSNNLRQVWQTALAPVCISLNIDTAIAACWGARDSHMGIPGEDRWAGRRFPYIQVIPIVVVQHVLPFTCNTQPTCGRTCVSTIKCSQSSSHPLTRVSCLCCSLAKAHLSMPPTGKRPTNSQSTNSLGFSLVVRSTASLYNMAALQIQSSHTTNTREGTTHTRNAQCWTWPWIDVARLNGVHHSTESHLLLIWSCSKADLVE